MVLLHDTDRSLFTRFHRQAKKKTLWSPSTTTLSGSDANFSIGSETRFLRFSPLNDWSNYHKQFTFLVNDNVDAELPIDHEDVSQLNRRSDSPNGSENRHDTPQQRSIGINQPPEYRKHTPEEYDEPDYSAALPPPGNPVQDGFNKIDQLYRSNYWD